MFIIRTYIFRFEVKKPAITDFVLWSPKCSPPLDAPFLTTVALVSQSRSHPLTSLTFSVRRLTGKKEMKIPQKVSYWYSRFTFENLAKFLGLGRNETIIYQCT